jgi:hypothetical protein
VWRRERRRLQISNPSTIIYLFEELSADNGLISPSHAIYSLSDIRALGQRSLAHWRVRLECVQARLSCGQHKTSIGWTGRDPPNACECANGLKVEFASGIPEQLRSDGLTTELAYRLWKRVADDTIYENLFVRLSDQSFWDYNLRLRFVSL